MSAMPQVGGLKELKKRVGVQPFSERINLDSDGYSACPFHDGDSNRSFHVLKKEDGTVLGTCFSECGKSWDAISFVRQFDAVEMGEAIRRVAESSHVGKVVELPRKEPAVPMTSEKWETAGRAVTDDDVATLAASRLHSATPSAAALNALGFRIGEKYGQTFLVAPYRLGNTFYTVKGRNLKTKEFIQENSVSQQGLFNIGAVTAGSDVFVVESELDAAVLYENGYTAVSVINAKQKSIETEVLRKLNTAARIFLVGDQDSAGQICMDAISKLLPSEKIHRISFMGGKDVGELAQTIKTSAGFLGDFKSNWEQLRTDALSSWISKNIPFVSAITKTAQTWVIDRLLPEGGLLMLNGKYGSMKSVIALWFGNAIERGVPVLSRNVPCKCPVLYIDRENPETTIGVRKQLMEIPDGMVRYWGEWLDERTPDINDPRLDEFMVREHGVIIFDSLIDFSEGSDENSTSEMNVILFRLRRLARLGKGVIVLHHTNKNGDPRGSTSIFAAADMSLKVTKTADGTLQLREDKFRCCGNWEMDIRFDFKSPFGCQVLRDTERFVATTVPEKTDSTDAFYAVRAVLSKFHEENHGAGMGKTALLKQMEAVFGINPRRAGRHALAQALANGTIEAKDGLTKTKAPKKLHYLVGWKPSK